MHADILTSELLATGPSERDGAPFVLFTLRGPDAGEFLHRLCTQDVLGLPEGGLRPAAFLDSKGKLQVTCLVFRLGDRFCLETAAEQADRLAALLERYHFTEKLVIERLATVAHERVALAEPGDQATAAALPDGIAVTMVRRGLCFRREHRQLAAGVEAPAASAASARAECLRMLGGFVRVGVDTEPTTLALEAGLDDHCSLTKGCYTGQEIVARIHTYGHVNRQLCLLRLAAGPAIETPQPLHEPEDNLPVGRVMHAVAIPEQPARLGLGYLPKDFQALGTRLALADGSAVEVIGYAPLPA
jgi:folate-binding protein YgfZ